MVYDYYFINNIRIVCYHKRSQGGGSQILFDLLDILFVNLGNVEDWLVKMNELIGYNYVKTTYNNTPPLKRPPIQTFITYIDLNTSELIELIWLLDWLYKLVVYIQILYISLQPGYHKLYCTATQELCIT